MNILLTSAGRRSYIVDYFKMAEGVGKVFASNSVYTIALKRADGYLISPLIYDPNYIHEIINFCRKNEIKIVLSLFDIDLLVLAQHCEVFKDNGIELILAPAEFVKTCNDKYATFQFLTNHGIKTPKTYINTSDVKQAISQGEISYPVIMKPRWGMASIGIYKVESDEDLEIYTRKCNNDIFNSFLKYESSLTKDDAIIYQEVMTGDEYGLDILNDLHGNYIETFAKQKITMRSGETDLGRTAESDPFIYTAKEIAKNGQHHGICSVDCFLNNGEVYVIEMNCRISGHYPLAYLAGFNYPQIIIDWMLGKGTNPKYLKFTTGLYIIKDLVPMILSKECENFKLQ